MRIVQMNFAYDRRSRSGADLLERYHTLTGWGEALTNAADVLTVQQFHSSAAFTRHGVQYVFGSFGAVTRAAAAFAPDIVHVNGLVFPLRIRWLRTVLPSETALVVQDHASGDPTDRGVAINTVRRWCMRAPDAFLFTAIEQSAVWRQQRFISPDQAVYAVPEASSRIQAMPREDASAISGVTGSPALVWVGRLNVNKDPLTVLEAFDRFSVQAPGATLTMVYHEQELLEALRARTMASPALRRGVRFVGEIRPERMAAFLSAADVFVLGSHHEGSGYALLEALACNAVPVVTDIPSFRTLTADGSIGALWPPGDRDACVRALATVISRGLDHERQRVRAHFTRSLTWDAIGSRAIAVYREVIATRGRARRPL